MLDDCKKLPLSKARSFQLLQRGSGNEGYKTLNVPGCSQVRLCLESETGAGPETSPARIYSGEEKLKRELS